MSRFLTFLTLAALPLAGCGGGGSGAISAATPIAEVDSLGDYATVYDRIYDASEAVVGTTSAEAPTLGTARYDGVAYVALAPEEPTGKVLAGTLTLDVAFADNTVSGGIDRFYERSSLTTRDTGTAKAGSLTIANGPISRSALGVGFAAEVTGEVQVYSDMETVTGTISGAFGGSSAEFARGILNISYPFEFTGLDEPLDIVLDGGFVAEAE